MRKLFYVSLDLMECYLSEIYTRCLFVIFRSIYEFSLISGHHKLYIGEVSQIFTHAWRSRTQDLVSVLTDSRHFRYSYTCNLKIVLQ